MFRGLTINSRLPDHQIIKKRKTFLDVYSKGRVVNGRFVKMFYLRGEPDLDFRFGITTTKKIGKAVIRNRSRRLIKEVIRKQLKRIKNGFSAVFVVKKSFVGRSYDEVAKDLERIIAQAGFIKN